MNTSLIITGLDKDARAKAALEIGLKESSRFDLSEIDTEEEKGIALIREIQRRIAKTPFSAVRNVIVVKEAQNLTLEAQNAFLKSLEEPPEKSFLILTAPNTEGLLPTIVSRCHIKSLGEQKRQLDRETKEKISEEIITLLKTEYGARLLSEPKIDFDAWLLWWREVLLEKILGTSPSNVGTGQCPVPTTKGDSSPALLDQSDIARYLHLTKIVDIIVKIEETKNLLEKRANKKLATDVLLLNLPKLEGKY